MGGFEALFLIQPHFNRNATAMQPHCKRNATAMQAQCNRNASAIEPLLSVPADQGPTPPNLPQVGTRISYLPFAKHPGIIIIVVVVTIVIIMVVDNVVNMMHSTGALTRPS